MEKSKTEPDLTASDVRFYQNAWHHHLEYLVPRVANLGDELHITVASIGTKKTRTAFMESVRDAVRQNTIRRTDCVASFWPAQSDPCLQISDYCTWAIQRKWERGDTRSYDLIRSKIATEFDLLGFETRHYY